MEIETNGDIVDLLLDYQTALQICNGKLDAIGKAYGEKGDGEVEQLH